MSNLSEVVIKSPNVTIDPSAFSNSKMHVCLVKIPEEVLIYPEGPNSTSYKNCQIAGTYSAKNEYGKYIAFEKRYTITLDITTPLGYALVDANDNSLDRTIRLDSSTSTYNLEGTCQKVWEKISDSTPILTGAERLTLSKETLTATDTRLKFPAVFSIILAE